jgi:hypothetical protein
MNFPEQTKAMKKSQRKALVFEAGSIPASFRAFGRDGFSPGKLISLDFLGSVFYQEKTNANAAGTAFKKKERWNSSENSLGGAADTVYGQAPGPKGKAKRNIRFFENESKESLDADGRRYNRICDACDVFVDNKLHYASGKGELFKYLDEITVSGKADVFSSGGDGTPDWVGVMLGAANSGSTFFEAGYLSDARQIYKYGARIDGKVRSAETLTRANRISSNTTAKYLGYAGKALGFYGVWDAGKNFMNDPSDPANWVKLGANTGMLFMKANPYTLVVGVGYTVLDQGGYVDDWFGNKP